MPPSEEAQKAWENWSQAVKTEPSAYHDHHQIENIPAANVKSEPAPDLGKGAHLKDGAGTDYLERLVSHTDPETLEGGVEVGLQVLEGLKRSLEPALQVPDTEAPHWMKAIQHLEKQAQPTRTVVGVVGNTGAGKSSVINALLDEEKLLPTNGLRACTACPSEVSWNSSEDPEELYRAEVEFITVEDWRKELKIILDDLLNDNGEVSKDCTNGDTEAGLAYAKIKAVYPHMTREDIGASSVNGLAGYGAVRTVLGNTKKLRARTSSDLYAGLQRYVDSKEKTVAQGPPRKDATMEYWPLIKVVRIYTKSWALETGAVIVDLPGVHDSNAARAAVAARYMQSCTGLWIVADITRAVDDKTAKSLLGDSFKRQLKYDGTYSAVTFICSKTDNISETEATESLPGIADECAELWTKMVELQKQSKTLQAKVGSLKDEKAAVEELQEQLDNKYDEWQELEDKLADGTPVYAPRASSGSSSKKRKRQNQASGSRKNRLSADSDDESEATDQDDVGDESDKENARPPSPEEREPLTEEIIEETLASIKEEKKMLRLKRRDCDTKIKEIKKQMSEVQEQRSGLGGQRKSICIKGRNEYSRGAIKNDFSAGIKELDQEAAQEEEDEDEFNPDALESLRDYEEVARSLPVFCVSSRGYQSMCGRLRKDQVSYGGFLEPEDTEIPQLQKHARMLTEAGRARNCRAFLNDLNQLLNSMKLWATMDGSKSLSGSERKAEAKLLGSLLQNLDKSLEATAEACVSEMKDALADQLYDTFEKLIPAASDAAAVTASGWGAHRSLGGMYWATYKATVRRNGVYAGASGPKDFNMDLFEPIGKNLPTPWERTFQKKLPSALDHFQKRAKHELRNFHLRAVAKAAERGTNYAGLSTLDQQLRSYAQAIADSPAKLKQIIADLQKEASRAFTPSIQESMSLAYVICTEERGAGSYARMKSSMINHVESSRHTMFRNSTGVVKAQLAGMCRQINDTLLDLTEDIFQRVSRDYETVLLGVSANSQAAMPRAERVLRLDMTGPLYAADAAFRPLVEGRQVDALPVAADYDEAGSPAFSEFGKDSGATLSSDAVEADELIAAQLSSTSGVFSADAPVYFKSEPQ